MSKPPNLTRVILLVTIVSFSATAFAANEDGGPESPVGNGIPGPDRIKADVAGHFSQTDEGLPVLRDLTSYSRVRDAFVTSSVREGDLLTLSVRLLLVDEDSRERLTANSRLTYQETDGGWKLLAVQRNGAGAGGIPSRINASDDC